MPLATWITFFFACWAISLSPGPGAIAAMSAGLNLGFRRGSFIVFGLVLGIWTQVVIVVAGLGAVIAACRVRHSPSSSLSAPPTWSRSASRNGVPATSRWSPPPMRPRSPGDNS